jgi:hypothetical protein
MSATPVKDDGAPVAWWSVPQAAVWISTRSDKAVVEAAGDLALYDAIRRRNLRRMSPLLPVSVDGSLPIQLEAAPHDLCRAACTERLKIKGSKWGTEESETVPIAAGFSVVDRYEEREGYCRATIVDPASAIGEIGYNYQYTNYWKHLYVSAAECRACWPPSIPVEEWSGERTSSTAATAPTYKEPVTYFTDRAPIQFLDWARSQHDAGKLITVPAAEDAMRGAEDEHGIRPGGLLIQGPGLSRDTIREWVKNELPEGWQAKQGAAPRAK